MENKTKLDYLYQASLELLEAETLEQSYQTVVKWAMLMVNAKYGSIFEPVNGCLKRVYTSDKKLYKVIPRANGGTSKVYKSSKYFLRDVSEITPFHPIIEKLKISSDISVGLKYDKEKLGVLSVLSYKNKPFCDSDLELIKLFAPLASHSIKQLKLKQELERTLSERDLFISMAAHEIRTPLTSIYAYSQYLGKAAIKQNPENQKYMDKVKFGVARLEGLINDFLSIQQINSNTISYKMEKLNLIEVVKDVIELFNLQFRMHMVKLIYDESGSYYIKGERGKLIQAFYNILKNAGKYTPSNKEIVINLKNTERQIEMLFSDHGKGIKQNDLEHIFEKFYRGKRTKSEGMGLGLFLTKNIIEAHSAKISVNSKIGKGTTFAIYFPEFTNERETKTQSTSE